MVDRKVQNRVVATVHEMVARTVGHLVLKSAAMMAKLKVQLKVVVLVVWMVDMMADSKATMKAVWMVEPKEAMMVGLTGTLKAAPMAAKSVQLKVE